MTVLLRFRPVRDSATSRTFVLVVSVLCNVFLFVTVLLYFGLLCDSATSRTFIFIVAALRNLSLFVTVLPHFRHVRNCATPTSLGLDRNYASPRSSSLRLCCSTFVLFVT